MAAMLCGQTLNGHKADVVPSAGVFSARVSQAKNNFHKERPGGFRSARDFTLLLLLLLVICLILRLVRRVLLLFFLFFFLVFFLFLSY
ncbi:MAG: hypothetical protein QF886_14570, partial [Planctomycetota bacterium]|nr:hypothetical protein [Planctomycetota bacterium]